MNFENTLSSKIIYKGKILTLTKDTVRLQNQNTAHREIVEHGGGAAVLAFDENENIFLVKQYRYAYGKIIYEIPAGKIEKNEEPIICAERELEEEIGYKCSNLEFMSKVYPSPGFLTEIIYIFLAKNMSISKQKLDPDEFLTVEKIPFKKAVQMVLDGDICDAKSCIAIMKYALIEKRG